MIQALLFAKHLHRFCCWFAVPVQWIQGFNFKLRANGRTISWELLRPFAKIHQFQTLRNNMQQGVQTDAKCNIQQCWEFLANNVRSVCTNEASE